MLGGGIYFYEFRQLRSGIIHSVHVDTVSIGASFFTHTSKFYTEIYTKNANTKILCYKEYDEEYSNYALWDGTDDMWDNFQDTTPVSFVKYVNGEMKVIQFEGTE